MLVHDVELANATWKLAQMEMADWGDATIDLYAPHQVSARNMDMLNKNLGLTPEKSHLNFMTMGNIGPAAVPVTLAMAQKEGKTWTGEHIGLLGIGSGLNCSMMSIRW